MTAVVTPVDRGLGRALRDAAPLLCSVGLLLAGGGLASTMLAARAGLEGFRPSVVGVVLAAYYAGYVGGSLFAPLAIQRVGHVRVFSGLAAVASGALLLHVVFIDPAAWLVLRGIVGLCISALYVVCETWLNGVVTNRSRGGLMAAYMIVVSGSMLVGQLLFSLVGSKGFGPFILASVLVSLAVVPVSLAVFPAPMMPEPAPISTRQIMEIAPLAVVGAAMAGFIGAAILTAGVVYATAGGFGAFATGALVGAALLGGVVLQLPVGSWSDRVDRRIVIAVVAMAAAVVSVVASQVQADRRIVLIALTAVAGGSAFPIYSLSVAHLNDYLDQGLAVAAGARMILINGVGAVAGPIVGSLAIGLVSPGSLYLVLAVAYVGVGIFAVYRITRRSAVEEDDRAVFSAVPVGVGPTTIGASEAELAELYPLEEGEVELGDLVVPYQVRGWGSPVILIDDPAAPHPEVLDELLLPLAANGVRGIAPRLGTVPEADVLEVVLSVLRHFELPSATFVGCGGGAEVAMSLAEENADRTDAVVLVIDLDAAPTLSDAGQVLRPALTLDHRLLIDSPSDVADDIAELVRRLVVASMNDRDTGRVDVIAS